MAPRKQKQKQKPMPEPNPRPGHEHPKHKPHHHHCHPHPDGRSVILRVWDHEGPGTITVTFRRKGHEQHHGNTESGGLI